MDSRYGVMKQENGHSTIYEILKNIESGRYVMPAFQRQYVWSLQQIEKLWDSIMIGYPVSNFLFWHLDEKNTSDETYFCNFLPSVTFKSSKDQPASVNYTLSPVDVSQVHTAVLDGQQRLTSLFISLLGEVRIRPKGARNDDRSTISHLFIELDKDKLDFNGQEYNSKRFGFYFTDKVERQDPTQFPVTKILDEKFRDDKTRDEAIEKELHNLPLQDKDYARNILRTLYNRIFVEKLIGYTELFDVNQDDALEIFVRFNSGGSKLSKTEITMSILEAYWPKAKSEFGDALIGNYKDFSTDFIVRSALMLYGDVSGTVDKRVAETLKNHWAEFKKALNDLEVVLAKVNIKVSHFRHSWNILIPILYSIYYNMNHAETVDAFKTYLARALIFDYFQNSTTYKLRQMKSYLINCDYIMSVEMLDQITELSGAVDAKIEEALESEKGSKVAGGVLYLLGLDWIDEDRVSYDQDHLHPYSEFDTLPIGIDREIWTKWRQKRNKLPNLQYLEAHKNQSKNAESLSSYYNSYTSQEQVEFRKRALIPEGVSLELKDFDNFYDARKELLRQKIKSLVSA